MLSLLPLVLFSTTPNQLLLKAAHLFTGKSEALEAGAVLIEGSQIVAVGQNISVPADAVVIDLGDATLLPGLIDAHTHLSDEAGGDYYRTSFERLRRFPTEQALLATQYVKRTLMAGFTTVRDLGSDDYVDLGLKKAIEQGVIPGPRMLISLTPLGAIGGHADGDAIPEWRQPAATWKEGICTGTEECRAAVREHLKFGADQIKVMASGGVLSLGDAVDAPQMTLAELTAVVEESHRLGHKVAAHCHGDGAAKTAVTAGVDSIEHGSFLLPATLALMKEKGTYLVPTLFALDWILSKRQLPPAVEKKAKAAMAARGKAFKEAVRIGVKIAYGTDAEVYPHGLNAKDFALMVQLGMRPAAALRSATSVGAELLGVNDRVGTLEKGKLADIVAVPGNPLDDITAMERVNLVVKNGELVKRP